PEPVVPVKISFTASQINRRLGTKLSGDVMCDILKKLGFGIETVSDESYTAVVPSWRNDVTRWEDLSEEVAQVYGFDEIPSTTPHGRVMSAGQSKKQYFIEKMKDVLCSLGLDETASFAFTHPSMYDKMQVPEDSKLRTAIPIMNPLTDEYPLVRTTLLSSVFENVVRNLSRKNEDVRLFEIAPVFYPKALPVTELPDEVMKAAGIITGRRAPLGWNQGNDEVDFYDLKGIIEELLTALSIKRYTVEVGEHYAMHPGKTAVIKKGSDILAYIGEVHPAVAEAFSVKKKMYAFEMDVLTLMKHSEEHFTYTHLPKYPAVSRDLALLVDRDLPAMDIEKVIKKNAGPYFKEVCLFDVYTGKQVDSAKKSVAFSLLFQSNDKTLTDAEVDEAFGKIVSEVEKLFGAELRA
ncbi:phenylalanine--tRNA ligase subunit beta, partial [Schwartzia sp. (in: firmicutes)]